MKEFFLILFFAKSIVITPEPIDIINNVSLNLADPVSAITSGAHVRIDLTASVSAKVDLSDIVGVLSYLDSNFPDGAVSGTLTTSSGDSVLLDRCSGSSNGRNAELLLSSSFGLPTGIDFSGLKIESSNNLYGVTVIWQNHQK